MTTLFSDGFESGDLTAWAGTNGTIAAAGAAAHAGSFGCDANSVDAYAFADFSAPASQIVSLQADVNLVSASGAGIFRILQISTQVGGASVGRLRYTNGSYDLWMNNKDGTTQTAAIAGITTGTWLTLQIVYDWSVANPTLKAYVNGGLQATLTDTSSGTTRTGDRVFILTFEDTAPGAGHTYFDAVLAEDTAPAGGTTYNETGGAAGAWAGSADDAAVLVDAGQALGAWASGALDTMTMVDAGGGVLIAVASGDDGSAPVVPLPYQGDTVFYSGGGAVGSISAGAVQPADAAYSGGGAIGPASSGTVQPAEVRYG